MKRNFLVITPSDRLGFIYSVDEEGNAVVVTPNVVEKCHVSELTPFLNYEPVRFLDLKVGDTITKFSGNKMKGSILIAKVVEIKESTITFEYDFDKSRSYASRHASPVKVEGNSVVAYLK